VNLALVVPVAAMLVVGAAVAWRAGGPPDEPFDPTPPVRLTVLAYLAFYGIGSLILLVTGESGGPGPLLVGAGMLAFGIGTGVIARAFGETPPMARELPPGGSASAAMDGYRWWMVVGFAVVGLVALAVLIAQNGIPLIARNPQASRAGFAGPIFDLFRWFVPPAALVAFAVALRGGQPRDRWIAGAALLGVGGVELALASRALPLELAIEALLVAWWAGRRMSARTAAGVGAAALVLFVGVQLVRVGPEGGFSGAADVAGFAVKRTVDRVLLIHPRTLELVASEIPAHEPYFAGATYFRRIAILLGQGDRQALGYWIYERLFPGETGGFAAPGVLGEAWANGGPVFAFAIIVALGLLAGAAGRRLAALSRGPTNVVFSALVAVAIARSYATSLNGLLLTLAVTIAWWIATTPRSRGAEGPETRPSSAATDG
jgi:hypothetical protein